MTLRLPRRLFRSPKSGGRRQAPAAGPNPALRTLRFQALEQRHLLAAYINELMVAPLFTGTDVGQYIEIRAEPNTALADGTYFVAVSEHGINGRPGTIHTIFDLSGQSVGSNGMLVIQQFNSPYKISEHVAAAGSGPSVLQSSTKGFTGLPGNIFSSEWADHGEIDFILGSNGYFLFQSDVAPQIGQDIDADNDGLIDPEGVASTWNIHDSISLHDGVIQGPFAYGQIAFVQEHLGEPPVAAAEGGEIIYTGGFGYAARIGDSTGHTASDWVASTARDMATGTQAPDYQLEVGIFGTPLPPALTGRQLDHLGESNFIGGVRGKLTEEYEDGDGELATRPFAGVSFLADTNGNATRDLLTYVVEPNNYAPGTDLTNLYPGVTLWSVGSANNDFGSRIQAARLPGLNQQEMVFSDGIYFFNHSRRVRADFYRPVNSVSIDVMGDGSSSATIGRLEAYNAQGELLQMVRSRPLFGTARETISVSAPGEQIAYVVAYPDSNASNVPPGQPVSSPFGRLDRLVFRQYEAVAVSDENGEFKLDTLQPGHYDILLDHQSDVQLSEALPTRSFVIDRYENFRMDLQLRRNSPPRIEPAAFTIDEHAPVGTSLGFINATDRDEHQTLYFAIADAASSPVTINPLTGELFVRNPAQLDFEVYPQAVVTVLVIDSAGGLASTSVVIDLNDVNEPPVVTLGSYSVFEDANPGSPIGRIFASDPDDPAAPLQFAIVGGTGAAAFAIGQSSGVMTVTDPSLIDFSNVQSLTLIVEVADASDPPVIATIEVPITVNDANDPPLILTETLTIVEDAEIGSPVGGIDFSDRDLGQSHTFRIIGDPGPFAIDAQSGVLTVAEPLDYDLTTFYDLTVQVVDNGQPPMGNQKTLRIDVLPAERPPTLVQTSFAISENSPAGAAVGTLVAHSRHGQTGYQFHSTDAEQPLLFFGGKVSVDPVSGELAVVAGAELDFETSELPLTDQVVLSLGGEQAAVVEIALNLLDVNEAPLIASTRLEVPAGLPAGRSFAELEAFDPEGDELTLELLQGVTQGLRLVAGNQLMVEPGSDLDLQELWPFEILVRATDANGLSTVAPVELVRGEPLRFGAAVGNVVATTGQLLNFALPAEYRGPLIRSLNIVSATGTLPLGLSFDPSSGRLSGIPLPQPAGNLQLTVEVMEFDGEVEILKQEAFELAVLRSATPLFNHFNPFDVDGNGRIEPIDALRVLNVIAEYGMGEAPVLSDQIRHFVDTSGDNQVQPLDALRVLNHLARRNTPLEPEGEGVLAGAPVPGETDDERQGSASDLAIQQWLQEASLF